MKSKFGTVYLVGAGPGDPDLITVKALKLLKKAQVIFYDNLVNPELLRHAPNEAKRIYVGKRGEGTSADQKIIEDQIVAAAKKGKHVVRLKGGDPFIFGRGGEEAERLAAEKIPFEVVSGVTSPIAVPASAGIPLTHRDFTQTVVFVTGHPREENGSWKPEAGSRKKESGVQPLASSFKEDSSTFTPNASLDWSALSKMGTIVFVMGVKTIRANMKALREAGKDPRTPVAVIRWGTTPKQKTIVGTVGDIAQTIEGMGLMPPAIIVVGEVVKLREKIQWFESKPFFGKRILVTRARSQASQLSEQLVDLGAEVIQIPTLEIIPPHSFRPLDSAIENIKKYDWTLLTSVNGVNAFLNRFLVLKKDIRDLAPCRLGAVGSATAEALRGYGLKADVIPEKFTGRDLARCFSKKVMSGKKVLIPQAKEGNEELANDLKNKGAQVSVVIAYETQIPKESKKSLDALASLGPLDMITFASSSAVRNFVRLLKNESKNIFLSIPCLCIGPLTEKTARELGFKKVGISGESTREGIVKTLLKTLISH